MLMSSAIGGQMSQASTAQSAVASRVGDYLRSKYPTKTAENVAADTGLKADAVKKALARGSLLNGEGMLALIRAYGLDFLGHVMAGGEAPAWLTSSGQVEVISSRDQKIAQLKASRIASSR